MQQKAKGKVIKIVSPFQMIVEEQNDKSIHKIQLKNTINKCYEHLLPLIFGETIEYFVNKKNTNRFRDEYKQGIIYLQNKEITSYYRAAHEKIYMSEEISSQKIFHCFISKVQCLKLELFNLENLKYFTFYFSELKLIRIGNIHPKQSWERAQSYFKKQIEGQFIDLKVIGSQKYKEQINIYGQISICRNQINLKQKIISDGYTELSKNAEKYIDKQRIEYLNKLAQKAKQKSKGVWQTNKNIQKSNMQAQQFKYREWEEWIKQGKKICSIKNEQEQIKIIVDQLCKLAQNGSKVQYNKLKVAIDLMIVLFENQFSSKYLKQLEEITKIIATMLFNSQNQIQSNIDNLQFLKYVCKLIIYLTFYILQLEKCFQNQKNQKKPKPSNPDLEKIVKFLFKLCYLGNETFHDKLFGKKKDYDYQNFSFDNAYLNGGISSLSECSDYQEADKYSKQQKKQKKITSAHQKIRINSTNLLSSILKNYPNIVQNYWQICVTSNILTLDFLKYLRKLRISSDSIKMTAEEKKEIVTLMRTCFGDHSLILLLIFERNNKVKVNAINCLLNMITNFQGKKLIATTQSAYIQKLLKQTKSSFVPKSFIIFSGLRNALYFLLFSLHYEKNIQIIVLVFKTLCQICNNCTLIDKMSFEDGIGLLIQNYIIPILQFSWDIEQLQQLKLLCINFLSVLVNTNKKWIEIEANYFRDEKTNINKRLIDVISTRKSSKSIHEDKIILEIVNYFTKLSKKYLKILFIKYEDKCSIWSYLCDLYLEQVNIKFTEFVEEVFKCYLDEVRIESTLERNSIQLAIKRQELGEFLNSFLTLYTREVTINNYLHLLGILTYIEESSWQLKSFSKAKSFLLHCFYSVIDHQPTNSIEFPSIQSLKTNSLIRIAMIKMIGYMSFCPIFQTTDTLQKSVRHLLKLSQTYKSLNSVVKITWGLSNWSKVHCFEQKLSEKQIEQYLNYMITQSQSDKQKIASNSTRGIGFFIANIGKKFDLTKCRKSIIKNLSHPIIKVRTNSAKTLLNLCDQLTKEDIADLIPTLEQNILKNNYHLQTETLKLLKALGNPIQHRRLLGIYVAILKNLVNYTTMEYEFSEIKIIKQLRFTVLNQIFNISDQIQKNLILTKEIINSIYAYLTEDCKEEIIKETKMIGKQFEKSEQAQKLIFNKERKDQYCEQKVILTETTAKGLEFEAKEADLTLIRTIKQFSLKSSDKLGSQWNSLSQIEIKGNKVQLNYSLILFN